MWITLFSNTGNELVSLCNMLGRKPDVIYCDKKRADWNPLIQDNTVLLDHDSIMNKLQEAADDCLVTLHGYFRIIPSHAIKERMYNVHPGDIVTYPFLKGKDPQEKALQLNLPSTGVVIHKVTDELDSGEIVKRAVYDINNDTVNSLTDELRCLSVGLWYNFLKDKI